MPSVFVKFFEDAIERTEEEIAELKAAGLLRDQPPVPGLRGNSPAAPPAETPAASQSQASTPTTPPQGDKSKEQK